MACRTDGGEEKFVHESSVKYGTNLPIGMPGWIILKRVLEI